jgi:hypothetical protein
MAGQPMATAQRLITDDTGGDGWTSHGRIFKPPWIGTIGSIVPKSTNVGKARLGAGSGIQQNPETEAIAVNRSARSAPSRKTIAPPFE